MAGKNGLAVFAGLLLATVMATTAAAAVPGEMCKSAPAPLETASPVVPAAEVTVPDVENKNTKDCPTSAERRADDDVCVFTPGQEKDKAPVKKDASPQVSRNDKGEGFVGQLLRTAGHVWSAVVTTLDVVTRDARL